MDIPEDFLKKVAEICPTLESYLLRTYDVMPEVQTEAFEPRKLIGPGGYHSPRCIAAGLATVILENESRSEPPTPVQVSAQGAVYQIVDKNVPVYYITEDLIRSVAATELPPGLQIKDIKLPIDGFVLGIPPKFMVEYASSNTCYVFISRLLKGENTCKKIPGGHIVVENDEKLGWFYYHYEGGRLAMFTSRYAMDDFVNEAVKKYEYVDYTDNPTKGEVAIEEERNNKISNLILKLLLVLNCRNGLITCGECLRKQKIKDGRPLKTLWSPNVIGKYYKIKREKTATCNHLSPRLHFRKGHWTWQVFGNRKDFLPISALPTLPAGEIDWHGMSPEIKEKFLQSHKRDWIDPILVGE